MKSYFIHLFNQKPNYLLMHHASYLYRDRSLSSTMYAVYRQAHTPTSVEFSAYCNFISSKEKNLVVAGTSQLFVYRIIHDVEVILPALGIISSSPAENKSFFFFFLTSLVIDFISEFLKIRQAHRYGCGSHL